jgi:hypothetical protein
VKRAIDNLRRLIRDQEYDISIHANEEMSKDALIAIDIEYAIRLFVEYSARVGLG